MGGGGWKEWRGRKERGVERFCYQQDSITNMIADVSIIICRDSIDSIQNCYVVSMTYLSRHDIIPEFSRPQRSFSWKSQIRFNIYGGGGRGVPYCVCSLTVSNVGMARLISSLSTYFKYWVITSFKCMFFCLHVSLQV